MNPPEIYRLFGPIAVIGMWSSVAFLVYNWRGDKTMTISKHAAAHRSAYLMMLAVQTIVFPLFILFMTKWLVPAFDLPELLSGLTIVAFAGYLLAAYVPDKGGWHGKVHGVAAYGASLLLIPSLAILCLSPSLSAIARCVALVVLLYQVIAIVLFTITKQANKNHLYFQVAYFLLFDVAVLVTAYIG